MRTVLQFRLRFGAGEGRPFAAANTRAEHATRRDSDRSPARRARPFDPTRPPAPGNDSGERLEPEEIQALQEKAKQHHHSLLAALQARLIDAGWRDIEEIPGGVRVIFEAKTVSDSNETSQPRSALAQLLEYRLEHGTAEDLLCLAVNREISLRRARLLDAFEVAVIAVDSEAWQAINDWGSELLES